MEISKKKFSAIVLVVALSTFALTYAHEHNFFQQHKTPQIQENVYFFFETAHGEWQVTGGNVITNIGENYTGSGNTTLVKYIAIGNVTGTLQTKTKLDSEYSRQTGTVVEWMNSGDYAQNCTYKWTFTEAQIIDGASIHWDPTGDSDNNMYAVANLSGGAQTFNVDDNCTIRWVRTYDAND